MDHDVYDVLCVSRISEQHLWDDPPVRPFLVRITGPAMFKIGGLCWASRFPLGNTVLPVETRISQIARAYPSLFHADSNELRFSLAPQDILRNLTAEWRDFWRRTQSARSIQRAWRRRRAATKIQATFRAWRWRRTVLWNPASVVGKAFLLQQFRRFSDGDVK